MTAAKRSFCLTTFLLALSRLPAPAHAYVRAVTTLGAPVWWRSPDITMDIYLGASPPIMTADQYWNAGQIAARARLRQIRPPRAIRPTPRRSPPWSACKSTRTPLHNACGSGQEAVSEVPTHNETTTISKAVVLGLPAIAVLDELFEEAGIDRDLGNSPS
jgi:hypothetical protein